MAIRRASGAGEGMNVGALEYVFWMGLLLPPPESMTMSWLSIVAVVGMFWFWYAKLPNI